MKKVVITVLSIISFIGIAFGQTGTSTPSIPKDSLEYCKTGVFRYVGMYSDMEIKRTKSSQLEYNYDKSQYIKAKVKWVSDDEYWLIFVATKNLPNAFQKGDVLKVKITKAGKNGYTCHFSINGHEGDCSFTREG